jgi:hypothetical protein
MHSEATPKRQIRAAALCFARIQDLPAPAPAPAPAPVVFDSPGRAEDNSSMDVKGQGKSKRKSHQLTSILDVVDSAPARAYVQIIAGVQRRIAYKRIPVLELVAQDRKNPVSPPPPVRPPHAIFPRHAGVLLSMAAVGRGAQNPRTLLAQLRTPAAPERAQESVQIAHQVHAAPS